MKPRFGLLSMPQRIGVRYFSHRYPAHRPEGQPAAQVEPVFREFKRTSRRVGLIGEKVGMTNMYDEWGFLHPISIIRVDDCHVVQIKEHLRTKMGYINAQIGYGSRKLKKSTLAHVGHCAKAGLPPKRELYDFKISEDAALQPGTKLHVTHFLPGQRVDISGVSRGKGFQGGMKRWGFSGQRATHGVSKTHRHIGSTGGCQDPGKVWKGKKMPGHMGHENTMQKSMEIFGIDPAKQCIFIRGSIPGPARGLVYLRDAWLKTNPLSAPFPTHFPTDSDDKSAKFMPASIADPFDRENTTPRKMQDLSGEADAIEDEGFDDSVYEDLLDNPERQ